MHLRTCLYYDCIDNIIHSYTYQPDCNINIVRLYPLVYMDMFVTCLWMLLTIAESSHIRLNEKGLKRQNSQYCFNECIISFPLHRFTYINTMRNNQHIYRRCHISYLSELGSIAMILSISYIFNLLI